MHKKSEVVENTKNWSTVLGEVDNFRDYAACSIGGDGGDSWDREVHAYYVGDPVRLRGLKTLTLNGKCGMISEFSQKSGRFVGCATAAAVNPTNPNKSRTKWSVRKLFALLGHFLICFLNFVEKMFKTTFNPCSIELNTQNPNTIFKIQIYYTEYTKHAKIHSNFLIILEKYKKSKIANVYFIFCINCII